MAVYVIGCVFLLSFSIINGANVKVKNCDINKVQTFLELISSVGSGNGILFKDTGGLNINGTTSDNENTTNTCVDFYRNAVEAYLDERWTECVDYMEKAIHFYKEFVNARINCRLKCNDEVAQSDPLFSFNVDDMYYYEKMLKKTLCNLKCRKQHKKEMPKNFELSKHVEKAFENRKPYEYLQICYYHNKQFQKAASAVFTYLVMNNDNKVMLDNLRYYTNMEGVDSKQIVNYEAEDYVFLYIHGVNEYEKENWKKAVAYMEESIIAYIQAEEKCRVNCEGSFDHGWFPDFTSAIANHFTYCLKCKRTCGWKLNTLNGERHDDLLSSHYHYLQFAYYKLNKLRSACEAVASYLLFVPNDETMLNNKDYYMKIPEVEPEFLTPRKEAIYYIQRQEYERGLLRYINKEFVFDKEPDSEVVEKFKNSLMDSENKIDNTQSQVDIRFKRKQALEQLQTINKRNLRLLKKEEQLNGTQRFLAEGYATKEECEQMVHLAEVAAVTGDGYYGNESPHTDLESISGLTIGKLSLLVYLGFVDVEYLETFIRISEIAKDSVERYFNSRNLLYFTFTHLVCRSALTHSHKNRTDLSHAIHADNCNLEDDGECFKQPPAYVWRDYSAIIYLNDDFAGGEFIFVADKNAQIIQSSVKPSCGRLVAFSSGKENLHGVKAVVRGTRCALGLWFTLNPDHLEKDWRIAKNVLHQVKRYGNINQNVIDALKEQYADELNRK